MTSATAGRNSVSQKLLILLATVICACQARGAPEGELDASFGQHGRMAIQVDGARFGGAISLQPADGKLLFPGFHEAAAGGQEFAVLRLNADGSRDDTFANHGVATIGFDSSAAASRLAVQPDGKIVAVGFLQPNATQLDFAIARLNTDGTIDSAFGRDGRVTLDLGASEFISDIVLLPGGGFVVVGTTHAPDHRGAVFASFEANGALDATFGTGVVQGTTIVGFEDRTPELASLFRQSDGKFVACGAASDYSELVYIGDMLAMRVTAEGSVDATFGDEGISRIAATPGFSSAQACTAMSDGTVMLAGFHGEPGKVEPVLARLMPDGALDATFGRSGLAGFAVGHIAWAQAILLLDDGTLAVTGFTYPLAGTDIPMHMFLAGIDANTGRLDPHFGNEGVTIVDFGQGSRLSAVEGRGLVEQADGKLIAVGHDYNSSLALARVNRSAAGSTGSVGFVTTGAVASEGADLVMTVQRTGGSTGRISVGYSAIADSATATADFTEVSGTLTWVDGEVDAKSITVPITDDSDDETAERFSLMLSSSTTPLTIDKVDVTLVDNDPAPASPLAPAVPLPSSGGGGATGIETITILALLCVLAMGRRRSCLNGR